MENEGGTICSVNIVSCSDEELAVAIKKLRSTSTTYLAPILYPNKEYLISILYRLNTKKYSCKSCGVCCKYPCEIDLSDKDIMRFSEALGITDARFFYLYKVKESNNPPTLPHSLPGEPCPFLKDNKCSMYKARPDVCRFYPIICKELEGKPVIAFYIHEHCARRKELIELYVKSLTELRKATKEDELVFPAPADPKGYVDEILNG
jgi:Fe-S-cluster containining protein